MQNTLLGKALTLENVITHNDLDHSLNTLQYRRQAGEKGVRLGDVIVEMGLLTRSEMENFVLRIHGKSGVSRRTDATPGEPTEFISTGSTDAPVVRYMNNLFRRAAREGFSDVHFEDVADGCVIRARQRGDMTVIDHVTQAFSREFDAKIRMKCKLSLVDRMGSLDGKFRFDVDGRFIDVRVSILPLGYGQSIVCRLLDQESNMISLDEIEIPADIRGAIDHIIRQPQGLFLVTGPTGSGKTTTLYSILQQLNQPEVKIITVEDPIEYRIAGICQAQANQKLTFASALKGMLRQDPDIILVGEIRDSETARIATQAALTGHIVLSTLHTNNALVTLSRMLDLDVDPHALSAAMGGFMAQRLVRELCPHCKTPVPINVYDMHQMVATGIDDPAEIHEGGVIYEPCGCEYCSDGWKGRMPVFELITSTPESRLAVESGDLKSLERAAKQQKQYRSLGHHAMQLVLEGRTSLLEAMAITGSAQISEI